MKGLKKKWLTYLLTDGHRGAPLLKNQTNDLYIENEHFRPFQQYVIQTYTWTKFWLRNIFIVLYLILFIFTSAFYFSKLLSKKINLILNM